jgi:uncharacterized protein YbaP (TraB family)
MSMPRGLGFRLLAVWALLSGAAPAWSDGAAHHILWEVKGRHNSVFLLGSVHLLRPDDREIPAEAMRAYEQARTLVLELDLNAIDPTQFAADGAALGVLPQGETLASAVGADLYSKFKTEAQSVGLEPELTDHFRPWFAAMLLEQMQLAKAGFDPSSGVDVRFAQRAQSDGKPVIGLETLTQQLHIFADLTADQQRDYLRSTLDDMDTAIKQVDQVIAAWQQGDTVKLEQLLSDATHDSPELFRKLTTDRNRQWLPRIEQMLSDDKNYLVIVGALHLIGRDGVIGLLQHDGYSPIQH